MFHIHWCNYKNSLSCGVFTILFLVLFQTLVGRGGDLVQGLENAPVGLLQDLTFPCLGYCMVIIISCQLGCFLSFASPVTQSCQSAHLEVLEWCSCALFTPDIQVALGCTLESSPSWIWKHLNPEGVFERGNSESFEPWRDQSVHQALSPSFPNKSTLPLTLYAVNLNIWYFTSEEPLAESPGMQSLLLSYN